MELTVQPNGKVIAPDPGASVLAALPEHAVAVSYSGTAGRCGTYRCR